MQFMPGLLRKTFSLSLSIPHALAGCGKTVLIRENFDSSHVRLNRKTFSQGSRARHARQAGRARLGGVQSVRVAPISHFTRHGLWRWRTFSASCQERSHAVADERRTDRSGLLWLRARRGPCLPNLCRLLVGRNALPENPVHLTFSEDASTSETPTTR